MVTSATSENHPSISKPLSNLDLTLVITDQNVLSYLSQFEVEEKQIEKAIEALKVGVIAIQSASPTLDTQVVQSKFTELEGRMGTSLDEFQKEVAKDLCRYFKDGEEGSLYRTFQSYFDPEKGHLSKLMQNQIGPESLFGKALNPQNKQGVIALIEAKIQELVEAKLNEVLQQFSLDKEGSAMFRLKTMLSGFFGELNQSLGIQEATAEEAKKGHVKGIVFEQDLYEVFAELGRQLGDDTEQVGGTVGTISRCKKGDFVSTLGETTAAPGLNLVVEVKDQPVRLKDAIDELQEAKKNREAAAGIFVFARGSEPPEVGDFRHIGEDFFCTVDKDDLRDDKPLTFFDSAYKIARVLAVAAARKESDDELDLQKIQEHIDALVAWSDRIADMSTKARTIQKSGKLIEDCSNELKQEMDTRLSAILKMLRRCESPA